MIQIKDVKVEVTKNNLKEKIIKKLNVKESDIKKIKITKQSLDARNKSQIFYVYEVEVDVINEDLILKSNNTLTKSVSKKYNVPSTKNTNKKIIIVGAGPSGLFCA